MMIPHNRPLITAEDRAAVDEVLASGWIAQGEAVAALEGEFVRMNGGGYACAVSSGTAALYMALNALGADRRTVVAVPTYACSALLNAVNLCGGIPRPVDVLPDSFCLDPEALESNAPGSRFAIAVNAFGAQAEIASIKATGRSVIDDCCQSLGTRPRENGRATGSALSVYSFYATKIITGGQGGLIWSRDPDCARACIDYRQFDCRENYVPRFNFQMTDIQAAMIGSQMKRLDAIRERRQKIAAAYLEAMPNGLMVQSGLMDGGRMVYRFIVVAPNRPIRDRLRQHLELREIASIVPVERYELLHRYLGLEAADFPVAERLVDTTLSLPIYPGLSETEIEQVVQALKDFRI